MRQTAENAQLAKRIDKPEAWEAEMTQKKQKQSHMSLQKINTGLIR